MNTISFREIVKLIHPDHNPNITDAGSKMSDVMKYRSDEGMLYRLGVHWGVIQRPEQPTPRPSVNRRNERPRPTPRVDEYTEFRRRNRIFQPGDVVFVRTKRTRVVVERVSENRVYFRFNGKKSWAMKKNVRFI
jgi:hypothetical protein